MRTTMTLAAVAFAAATVSAQIDQQQVSVVVDGEQIHFRGEQPTEVNGRVLVPLRGIFERLGATVDWDPSTQTVTARRNGIRVRLTIGNMDASVNRESVHMDVPATVIEGDTMVPLRFVSEALGAYVNWDQADHEVDITSHTNYHFPERQPTPPPAPPPAIPPPPPATPPTPPVVVVRPLRPVSTFREIPADVVLPFVLDSRLSSYQSHPGDVFSATLETNGHMDYLGLPRGTQAYGTIAYVRAQHRRSPGVIELRFDHLVLPDGHKFPLDGHLISMKSEAVTRRDDGAWEAANREVGNRYVFVGYGTGMLIPLASDRPLAQSNVDDLIYNSVGHGTYHLAHDVVVPRGSTIGARLSERLIIPRAEEGRG